MASPCAKFQVFWLKNDVIMTQWTFSVSDIWVFGCFVIMTSKWRHTLNFLMNLNSGPKNSPMCQIWAWSSNYLENNSSFFVFSTQKMTWHTGNKRLLWQHLTTMVIDKIRKMSIKGVKLKSESFFSISPGVLELWRKNIRGDGFRPPPVQIGLKQKIQDLRLFIRLNSICMIAFRQ